jgi:hypothetical protein
MCCGLHSRGLRPSNVNGRQVLALRASDVCCTLHSHSMLARVGVLASLLTQREASLRNKHGEQLCGSPANAHEFPMQSVVHAYPYSIHHLNKPQYYTTPFRVVP